MSDETKPRHPNQDTPAMEAAENQFDMAQITRHLREAMLLLQGIMEMNLVHARMESVAGKAMMANSHLMEVRGRVASILRIKE